MCVLINKDAYSEFVCYRRMRYPVWGFFFIYKKVTIAPPGWFFLRRFCGFHQIPKSWWKFWWNFWWSPGDFPKSIGTFSPSPWWGDWLHSPKNLVTGIPQRLLLLLFGFFSVECSIRPLSAFFSNSFSANINEILSYAGVILFWRAFINHPTIKIAQTFVIFSVNLTVKNEMFNSRSQTLFFI